MTDAACELVLLSRSIGLWQHYDASVKADLFSTAIITDAHQVAIVDPIPLSKSQLERLRQLGQVSAIVITNGNHHRAAAWFSDYFSAPIFAHCASFPDGKAESVIALTHGDTVIEELHVIEIDGATLGEIALYTPENGGTLVIGDALINFAPYGFALLPRKYCTNQKQMRRSLRKLLDRDAQHMVFAHGSPILSRATDRLRQLLDVDL